MEQLTYRYKALSDETRLRMLMLLKLQPLCVCQLQGILEESQPKISKHLRKLKDFGVVKDERRDQFIYYALIPEDHLMLKTLEVLESEALMSPRLVRDRERLVEAETFLSQCGGTVKLLRSRW